MVCPPLLCPMQLLSLKLQQFKNYQSADLSLNGSVVCITGMNGAGKTNLLDAIYYLSTGFSKLNRIDSQNIKSGCDYFTIEGKFEKNEGKSSVFCGLMKGKKKRLRLNGEEYKHISAHYGKLPCIMISPLDLALITEGSEERRKFVDSTISLYDDYYLDCLMQYNVLMSQRNAHIKQHFETRKLNINLIDVYDKQMAQFSKHIYAERQKFLEEFKPFFHKTASQINLDQEALDIRYSSQLDDHPEILELARSFRQKDLSTGRTEVGIHRDKWVFSIDDMPLKRFGSQGQQKSYLMALMLAKTAMVRTKTGTEPILLLDDLFDRLDDTRVKNLMNVTANGFGQVIITDTSAARLKEILNQCGIEAQFIEVENGTAKA